MVSERQVWEAIMHQFEELSVRDAEMLLPPEALTQVRSLRYHPRPLLVSAAHEGAIIGDRRSPHQLY